MSEKRPLTRFFIVLSTVLLIGAGVYVISLFYSDRQAPEQASTNTGHPGMDMTPINTQSAVPIVKEACKVKEFSLGDPGTSKDFAEPDAIVATDGVLTTTLTVKYADNMIAECPVHLRSYNGNLVGPTLRARPGETLRITLKNDLPPDMNMEHEMNTIGALNHTNLHTHGLHVSPAGNSDNVLLDIGPSQTFEYEIKIPLNQVPGTYWYHAHMHGSTATQVGSGMEGALIIMGDQIPNTVDSLLSVKAAAEKIFVIQQLIYDETGHLEPDADGNAPPGVFPTLGNGLPPNQIPYFGPCSWEPMERALTINGQMFPVLTMAPGEVQRWRMIDSGIRESIGVQLVGPYPIDAKITDISQVVTIGNNGIAVPVAPGRFVDLNEIAVDGIALNKVVAWKQVELEPGYRSDVMVQLTASGKYFLVDTGVTQTIVTRDPITGKYSQTIGSSESLTCPNNPEKTSFLASVVVSGKTNKMNLPTTAEMADLPLPFQPIVMINPNKIDPATKQEISPYSENYIVALEKIDAFQHVDFTVSIHPALIATATPDGAGSTATPIPPALAFMAADHPFDDQNRRRLKLDNTEEWILNTQDDSLYYAHPFHIHVNPFQVMRWGPDGVTRELVWKDTILVKQGVPTFIFTRYEDYIGAFVYHCHILDHEDQGMMEIVEVVP